MQQKQKLGINFGFRGWMLLIFQLIAFFVFQAFGNFPMNMLGDLYGGAPKISPIYTVASLVGIVAQLILAGFVGKMKSVKAFTLSMGVITLICGLGVAALPLGGQPIWLVAYFLFNVFANIYGMFGIGILVGQWFPTRKGVFMGIATFAFPICNGLMGPFANIVFNEAFMAANHHPNVLGGFAPFLIAGVIGWFIGLIFIKDYPEQAGCFRDNDKSFTKEKADAMLAAEIEAKKTTVWKIGNTFKCGQFWLVSIPMGTLLMCAVGMMSQTTQVFAGAGLADKFEMLMGMVMIFALIGSFVLGLIDDKFGTKTAILVAEIIMLVSGILGAIGGPTLTIVAVVLLALFMGASSNFTVSGAAKYWRREDFSTVFGYVNPIANILQCFGPMIIAITVVKAVTLPFTVTAIIAVISIILIACFKPAKVKEADDKYRAAAGKPLDDALVGRK